MITITELAKQQVLAAMEEEDREGLALRVAIEGRGSGGFRYSMDLVGEEEKKEGDLVQDEAEFKVFVDQASVANLDGATIDFVQKLQESGFKFENPNSLWDNPLAESVQKILDDEINPQVASHGGFVTLLEVKDDVAYIALGGGCQGCGMADVTLKQGIEVMIKQAEPSIKEVLDNTDHAAGNNPYYQPSKGAGDSPFT